MNKTNLLEYAKSLVGIKEGSAEHKKIIDAYNSISPRPRGYKMTYTASWCAAFITHIFDYVGLSDLVGRECSCTRFIEIFKDKGIWIENENRTPNIGDIVIYDWQDSGAGDNKGAPNHIGIVSEVSGNTFKVIEGNYSDSVKVRTMAVNGKYLRGFAVPNYPIESPTKSNEEIAKEVIAGKWSNGSERKEKLTDAGYDYSVIQAIVNNMCSNKKSNEEIALEVINGDWGNGDKRKESLTHAGYNYDDVQKEVNRLLTIKFVK